MTKKKKKAPEIKPSCDEYWEIYDFQNPNQSKFTRPRKSFLNHGGKT